MRILAKKILDSSGQHSLSNRPQYLWNILKMAEKDIGKPLNKMKILDVGTGKGNPLVVKCLEEGIDCYGITLNEEDTDGERIQYSSIEDTPYGKKIFDLVFCSHTIEHIFNIFDAFCEINRILKVNGYFVLLFPVGDYHIYSPMHIILPTPEQILNIAKKTNFKVFKAKRIVFYWNREIKKDYLFVLQKTNRTLEEYNKRDYPCYKIFEMPFEGCIQELKIIKCKPNGLM